MSVQFLQGDVREVLPTLDCNSVDCIVTSPPYWGLRDYGDPNQIGREQTMTEYLDEMVEVCRELKRVLKPTGTFWLNIGDCYVNSNSGNKTFSPKSGLSNSEENHQKRNQQQLVKDFQGLKKKNLCMIPNRLAIMLQEDGWIVRSEIIWHKPVGMPESVRDRPTNCHEKVWLLTKSEDYYYDADAIRENPREEFLRQVQEGYNGSGKKDYTGNGVQNPSSTKKRIIERARKKLEAGLPIGANARNVWTIAPKPFAGAHFATMPQELAERCIRAGCRENGVVLDPFGGAGTTGVAANATGRSAILCELNPEYIEIAKNRIKPNLLEYVEDGRTGLGTN